MKICKLIFPAILVASCWSPSMMREASPSWSSGKDLIVLPGDNIDGSQVCDTITVTSNRSWSAAVVQDEQWLDLSVYEHLNLEEFTTDVQLIVRAADNRGGDRKAEVCFTSDGITGKFDVLQSALVPRLIVKTEQERLPSDASVCAITVLSNMAWTAEVSPESTAEASLDIESGEGNGIVNLSVTENPDIENTRMVRLIFKARDCEDVYLDFVQDIGLPYLRFEDGKDSGDALPAYFDYIIRFKTNVSWTASIEQSEGFDSVSLDTESGDKTATSLAVHFPPASCFGSTASVKVRLQPEGADAVFYEIRQEPALGAVMIDALTNQTVGEDKWPFSSPSKADIPSTKIGNDSDPYFKKENELVLRNGYTIGLYSNAGMWVTKTTGMNAGGGAGSYLVSPAVPGYRLARIYYRAAGTPKRLNFSVCKEDKTTLLSGGEEVALSASKKDNMWELSGTEPGVRYYFINSGTGNFYLAEVIFYYE